MLGYFRNHKDYMTFVLGELNVLADSRPDQIAEYKEAILKMLILVKESDVVCVTLFILVEVTSERPHSPWKTNALNLWGKAPLCAVRRFQCRLLRRVLCACAFQSYTGCLISPSLGV